MIKDKFFYNFLHLIGLFNRISAIISFQIIIIGEEEMNTKIFSFLAMSAAAMVLFSGCVSSGHRVMHKKGDFVYRGHDFGPNRDTPYRQGVMDGCKTKDGDYTKDHTSFNTNESYHMGWEHGRMHCKARAAQ